MKNLNFKEAIGQAEALILDVDGVLTAGEIIPTADGDFIRKYYAKDGYAIAYAIRMGYKINIITGGRGQTLKNRIEYYGIKDYYYDCTDKITALNEYMQKHGLNPEKVIYMGDDIPDLECMRAVGLPIAPSDAAMEVLESARYVSEYGGGKGCVRDIIEQWLRARGDWARHLKGVCNGIRSM